MGWTSSGMFLVVRMYALIAGLALFFTWPMSRAVFVTTAVIVAVLTVGFVFGMIKLHQHFQRYPTHPDAAQPARDRPRSRARRDPKQR